ncbi:MAG: hypothetical protein OXN17_07265 [Candidatus Poribacteria bacterium]|nr:hypothetical protein [Candidatus Poribacteria bacterium]
MSFRVIPVSFGGASKHRTFETHEIFHPATDYRQRQCDDECQPAILYYTCV